MPGADGASIAALVITYNAWPVVGDTLRALAGEPLVERVVVVDNASPDGTADAIEREFPSVHVVRAPTNAGYASAFNRGLRELDPEAMVLAVTHETLFEHGAIAALVSAMEGADPDVAAVGPLLGVRSIPDTVWSAGGLIDRRMWRPAHAGSSEPVAAWRERAARPVEWLDGACILFRSDALRAVGPMDETFFLYYEELDYFMRLQQAGYRALCVPTAVAFQQPGDAPPYLMTRNRLRVASRRGGSGAVVRVLGDLLVDETRRLVRRRRGGRTQRLLGVLHFLVGRDGPPPARVKLAPSSDLIER